MEDLEKKDIFTSLLLVYGKCLTDKKRNNMMAYYFDDLSLGEIAENQNISRNAVYLSLKQAEKELLELEEKLHFLNFLKDVEKDIKFITDSDNIEEIKNIAVRIKKEINDGI